MTITKHDRIALIPTRCDYCNRLFIFEPYDIRYREVGIEHYDLKQRKCLECLNKSQPMVADVSPEIETEATGNNFYDLIEKG